VGGDVFGATFGLNYKLPALSAALGLTQLAKLDRRLAARRRVAGRLATALAGIEGMTLFPMEKRGEANCYALLISASPDAAHELGAGLQAAGVIPDTLRYDYRPLYETPVFRSAAGQPCPNAEQLCATLLTLPCHEGVTPTDEQRIVDVCRKVLGS
jgi:perosamine synthetase